MLLISMLVLAGAGPAGALLSIDFEQPFYVHPDWQVWDFCIVEDQGTYHIFYLAVPEANPQPSASDIIWHATSTDLRKWSEPEPAITVSEEVWETRAVWAPDVVWDEASSLWWMAYTAVDELNNQRICMASSANLDDWTKSTANPVFEPTGSTFLYRPEYGWAECRDPYLYHDGELWHMLATALLSDLPQGRGAVLHTTSTDLKDWAEPDVFMANDGETPWNALESVQYHQVTGGHHLFLHEYSSQGITHLAGLAPADWTFADRLTIDLGIAPEVDSFDGGQTWILSRSAPYQVPNNPVVSVAIRVDSLVFRQGAVEPSVFRADPWDHDFAAYSGSMCLGNPCFGDNPAARGDPPAGLVGNSYFGSREYNRGPLSNRGAPGVMLGNTATGVLMSHDFVIEGSSIEFLIGGSDMPDLCFIALMDAATDTVIMRATGPGSETMVPRTWDVAALQGRSVYLRIEDSAYDGYLNLDEIHETDAVITAVDDSLPAAVGLVDVGATPNPFNPSTRLSYRLAAATEVSVSVHDLRGRRLWRSDRLAGHRGENHVTWTGIDDQGRRVPGGVYVYRIVTAGGEAVAGKVTLVP
jgi:hypothetical protein